MLCLLSSICVRASIRPIIRPSRRPDGLFFRSESPEHPGSRQSWERYPRSLRGGTGACLGRGGLLPNRELPGRSPSSEDANMIEAFRQGEISTGRRPQSFSESSRRRLQVTCVDRPRYLISVSCMAWVPLDWRRRLDIDQERSGQIHRGVF